MPAPARSQLQLDEASFVQDVSAATGLDPRVLLAWIQSEGAYAANGTGGYNFLNLRPYAGSDVGVSAITSGNFDNFDNVKDASKSTVARIEQPFLQRPDSPDGLAAVIKAHGTPAQEIAAIAASGWDAGHYGGPGGPNLAANFQPQSALNQPPQTLPKSGGGSIVDNVISGVETAGENLIPGGSIIAGVGSSVGGVISDLNPGKAISSALSPFEDIYKLFKAAYDKLTSQKFWIEAGFFVGGIAFLFLGIKLALSGGNGSTFSLPKVAPIPV